MSQPARIENDVPTIEEMERKLQDGNSAHFHERMMSQRDTALEIANRRTNDLVTLTLADRKIAQGRGEHARAARLFLVAAAHRIRVVTMKAWLAEEPS